MTKSHPACGRRSPLRSPGAILAASFLAAAAISCDDVNFGAPKPPGPTCARLDDFIHTVAIGRPPGRVFDAAVVSSCVFTANGPEGVFALEYSDPSNVHAVAAFDTLSDARAVDADGSRVFVADGGGGLVVIDASNLAAPRIVATVAMPGDAVDVRAANGLAYVANDVLGLVIVDTSKPATASIVGIENTPGKAVGVAVSGPLAYVADEMLGLRIVNIADPASPFLIRSIAMPGFVEAVDAQDDLAAVAVGSVGLALVDASDPASAAVVGNINTPTDAIAVALSGSIAYVADQFAGVMMVDVHDPAHPVMGGVIGTASFATNVALSSGRLVLAEETAGVRVVDISPQQPAPFDSLAADGNAVALAPLGDLIAVADASFGLRVVDPVARQVVGELATGSVPNDVFIADSVAYVARGRDGVMMVDLHDPTTPVNTGLFAVLQQVDALAIVGPLAYLLDHTGSLNEQRIDDPGTARVFYDTAVDWPSFTIDQHRFLGTIIYLPNARGTVLIIPAFSMTPINELPMAASPQRVVIQHYDGPLGPGTGTLVYVAESGFSNGQSGIELFDVSDLQAPVLLGRLDCGGNPADLALYDTRMAVAEGADGCEIFEQLAGIRARPDGMLIDRALRVAISKGTLVVAGGKSGILLTSLDECLK